MNSFFSKLNPLLLLLAIVATAFAQQAPPSPPPAPSAPSPSYSVMTISATEKAQIEQTRHDGVKAAREAAKLLKREQELQKELQAVITRLNELNRVTADVQKVYVPPTPAAFPPSTVPPAAPAPAPVAPKSEEKK